MIKKTATPRKALAAGLAKALKRLHYPLDVMATVPNRDFLRGVRWYVAHSLSLRNLEETMAERSIDLAAPHAVNAERETRIKIRQVKYLNNVVEQDHWAIKRITRPTPRRKCPWGMLGFKNFDCARAILSGIEVMHTIKKGQMKDFGKIPLSAAQQFYSLIS